MNPTSECVTGGEEGFRESMLAVLWVSLQLTPPGIMVET